MRLPQRSARNSARTSPAKLTLTLALTVVMTLTACGGFRESRLNPLNWFGRSREATVEEFGVKVPVDKRGLIEQVLGMVVEETPNGAIVRATGLAPKQGFYDAELVLVPPEEGETDPGLLVYEFRVMASPYAKPVGAPRTREITVATHLSHIKLEGVTKIVVKGQTNARTSGR